MPEPEAGASAQARLVVEALDLANALSPDARDTFPEVFATARMVALMEIASSRVLLPFLNPGELSVGVMVNVAHTAATPLGAMVTATARFLGREGKLFVFEVVAADPGGEIGRGTHKRAVVGSERLVSGAKRRMG
ncbi:MAG: thioesterase [Acidobacteriota bacterium]